MEGRPNLTTAESTDPIVRFFNGTGTDRDGRTLDEILDLDHHELEADHRFVQWLFPTPEKSSFGYFAPRLSEEGIAAFHASSHLRDQLRRAFRHILDFYGLELAPGDRLVVREASTFSHRAGLWVTDGNHNFLRISRVLRATACLGLEAEASALLAYLEDLYERRPNVIGARTMRYWRLRAGGSGEELPSDIAGVDV